MSEEPNSLEEIPLFRSVTSRAALRGAAHILLKRAFSGLHDTESTVLVDDRTELVELAIFDSRK